MFRSLLRAAMGEEAPDVPDDEVRVIEATQMLADDEETKDSTQQEEDGSDVDDVVSKIEWYDEL